MKTTLLLSALALGLTYAAFPEAPTSRQPAAAPATSRGGVPEARMDPSMVERAYLGTVVEVHSWDRMMVVADRSQGMQTLHVDQRTAIRQGDREAKWEDIRPGVMVDGLCVGPFDNAYAETVNIGR